MKTKLLLISTLLLVFVAVGWTNQSPKSWEYKTEDKCFDDKRLNTIGSEGWELAGFAEGNYGGRHCIFKRPKG